MQVERDGEGGDASGERAGKRRRNMGKKEKGKKKMRRNTGKIYSMSSIHT